VGGRIVRLRSPWNALALVAFLCGLLVSMAYATDPGIVSRILGSAASLAFLGFIARLPFVRADLRGDVVHEVRLLGSRDWRPIAAKPLPGAGWAVGATWVPGLLLEGGEVREIWWQTVYGRAETAPRKLVAFCQRVNESVGGDPRAPWPDV
jgi:hypothetical protein